MRLLSALVIATLCTATPVWADNAQDTRTRAIISRYDAAISAALDADPKLKSAMDRDLKTIAATLDPKAQAAVAAAYRAKYTYAYQAILKAARVDLNAVARDLKAVYPNMTFVVRDFAVIGLVETVPPVAPPPARFDKTITLKSADYAFEKSLGCGVMSGAGVTYDARSLDNSVWAAQVGGCVNAGRMSYDLVLPSGGIGHIAMKGDLSNEVFALGIGGGAQAHGESALTVSAPSGNQTYTKSCSVTVLIAWAATHACEKTNAAVGVAVSGPGAFKVSGWTQTRTIALGVVAGTSGHARARAVETVIRTATPQ